MDPRSTNVVVAIASVLAVLLAVIALAGKDMTKNSIGGSQASTGLWGRCVHFKGTDKNLQLCGSLDANSVNGDNLLKVARPFAGVSLLLLVVGMVIALLGAQTSKKGLYVALLILLGLGALGSWVTVVLIAVFKNKNTGTSLGGSWIVYIVAAGLATLGAVFSGIGIKSSEGPGAVMGSLTYEA